MKCGQIVKVKYHLQIDTKNLVCAISGLVEKVEVAPVYQVLKQQKINTHRLLYFFRK